MNGIDKIAGIGITIKIKGKDYKLSPLTIGDYGEIAAFTKAMRLRVFEMADPSLSMKDKIEILQATPTADEIDAAMRDISGIAFQLYLQIKAYHPDITRQEVARLIDMDNYREITDTLIMMSAEPSKNVEGQATVSL